MPDQTDPNSAAYDIERETPETPARDGAWSSANGRQVGVVGRHERRRPEVLSHAQVNQRACGGRSPKVRALFMAVSLALTKAVSPSTARTAER